MIPARCYPPSEPRYKNEELEVIATYIENPGFFFVQKVMTVTPFHSPCVHILQYQIKK